jgi:hypothetical protein
MLQDDVTMIKIVRVCAFPFFVIFCCIFGAKKEFRSEFICSMRRNLRTIQKVGSFCGERRTVRGISIDTSFSFHPHFFPLYHIIRYTVILVDCKLCLVVRIFQFLKKTVSTKKELPIALVRVHPVRKRMQSLIGPSIKGEFQSLHVLIGVFLNSSYQRELVKILNQNASPFVTYVTLGRSKQLRLLISS